MSDLPSLSDQLLVIWLLGPYLAAFVVVLLPASSTTLILLCSLATAALGSWAVVGETGLELQLLQEYGVSLSLDPLAGWLLLLGGLVCLGV
jgi:multicomponent Na+:H+ antiporter subunit D